MVVTSALEARTESSTSSALCKPNCRVEAGSLVRVGETISLESKRHGKTLAEERMLIEVRQARPHSSEPNREPNHHRTSPAPPPPHITSASASAATSAELM